AAYEGTAHEHFADLAAADGLVIRARDAHVDTERLRADGTRLAQARLRREERRDRTAFGAAVAVDESHVREALVRAMDGGDRRRLRAGDDHPQRWRLDPGGLRVEQPPQHRRMDSRDGGPLARDRLQQMRGIERLRRT